MSDRLYIGIDGGQSSTKAVIATADGRILARGVGSPCDHLHGPNGYERNRAAIHSALNDAIARASVNRDSIAGVGMALTSCPPEINAQGEFEAMLREAVSPDHVWIHHDVAGNLAGAAAGGHGVIVIGGGGSIGYGLTADGREAKSGGMGYLMGDEGSAWWIGLEAIRAAAKSVDGRGPETAILPLVLTHYDLPTIRHLYRVLYGPEFTRDQVSVLAPEITKLALSGDVVANQIVHTAGQLLAGLASGAISQLFTEEESVAVYPTGGVFAAGELITEPFADALWRAYPLAEIRQPAFSPAIGALLRAYEVSGIAVNEEVLANLRATAATGQT